MRKGSMRKALSFILSLILVLSMTLVAAPGEAKAASASGRLTIKSDKTELRRGDNLTVTVEYSENTVVAGFAFTLHYDTELLELQGEPTKGSCYGEGIGDLVSKTDKGTIRSVIAKNGVINNGTVFSAEFKVKDTASGTLKMSIGDMDFVNDYAESVASPTAEEKSWNIVVPVEGISLNKTSMELARGASEKLTAALKPEGATSSIAWTSSNEKVATVSDDGTVKAVGMGTAKITATASGKSASCDVKVNAPLNGIQIKADRTTLKKGETTSLVVVYDPEDTTDDKAVTWTSSDESVATVDKNGKVTAIADGKATITAKVGTHTADVVIMVQEVKLTGISLNKQAVTIHRGENAALEVSYQPENTTDDRTVTWTSSDESIVKVDASGKLTAAAIGSAIITAKVGNFTDTCIVTVDAPLVSITPDKDSIALVKNQTADITYALNPVDTTDSKDITFKSSAPEVATVDNTGKVTAKKAGNATITLTGANDTTATVEIVVTEIPINEVVLDKHNSIVEKGESVQLMATVKPDNTTDDDKTITWTSSDESIVTVTPGTSKNGEAVTATATDKGGTATITAKAWNGTVAECEITVPVHLESIKLPSDVDMNKGTTKVLEVTYNPENTTDEKTVTWKSDNEDVASVDPATGMITAKREGKATITATAKVDQSISASTVVTVKENHLDAEVAKELKLQDMKEALLKGQSFDMSSLLNLSDTIEKNQITDDITVEWTVSDDEIAAIDQSGLLRGIKKGTVTVTAVITAEDALGNLIGEYTLERT